jgi:hypothetical protein
METISKNILFSLGECTGYINEKGQEAIEVLSL